MLQNFFKLNGQFKKFMTVSEFEQELQISKHMCNILFEPDRLESMRIQGVTFENFSFSKTSIEKTTFKDCKFKDCLFIGTEFKLVEFHDCVFECCNFFKSKFINVYARPRQFKKAVTDINFANIAIHLYQQLRENYYQTSQREFKNEAEYCFSVWKRKNDFMQAKRKKVSVYKYWPKYILSYLYDITLGYGYKLTNLVVTTFVIVFLLIILNHIFSSELSSVNSNESLLKSTYFTITTMATLGASGYAPKSDVGYLLVIVNVLTGVSIFSVTINSIFKKVIR